MSAMFRQEKEKEMTTPKPTMPEWAAIKTVVWHNGKPWQPATIEYEPKVGADEWRDVPMEKYLPERWSASFPDAVENMPVNTALQSENAELKKQVEGLAGALSEAMEWNWLDDDMDEEVKVRCEESLAAYQKKKGV